MSSQAYARQRLVNVYTQSPEMREEWFAEAKKAGYSRVSHWVWHHVERSRQNNLDWEDVDVLRTKVRQLEEEVARYRRWEKAMFWSMSRQGVDIPGVEDGEEAG